MQTTKIYGSRLKYGFLLFIGEPFLMGGGYVLAQKGVLGFIAAIPCFLFFGLGGIFILYKLISPCILIITDDGFYDRSSLMAHRKLIPWSNVAKIDLSNLENDLIMPVILRDNSGINARILKMNRPFGGDLLVNLENVKSISIPELQALIQKYLDRFS